MVSVAITEGHSVSRRTSTRDNRKRKSRRLRLELTFAVRYKDLLEMSCLPIPGASVQPPQYQASLVATGNPARTGLAEDSLGGVLTAHKRLHVLITTLTQPSIAFCSSFKSDCTQRVLNAL